ncbi:MAG: ABC transporter ATP-binding protein [Planctomycetaceae bacterium]|nr:ABC transporter ATP-binding protein [Planctomycetaceae bacterium]
MMIEFENVTRCYARKVAVDRLTLTVPPGELFTLLGPNGAGKTTTIKMVTGLLRPTGGSVRVCGHDVVGDQRNATLAIGYVPEEPFLYDKLTGREFLEFAGQMRGLTGSLLRNRIARESEFFELADYLDDLAESYSHGMRQRLVFASAMLHDPPALVVDEPMVGLDPRSVRAVKDRLRARADAGTIVFMSTHTLAIAEEIADRIGIMDHGQLRTLCTRSELETLMASHHASLEGLFLELTNGANGKTHKAGNGAANGDSVGDLSLEQ